MKKTKFKKVTKFLFFVFGGLFIGILILVALFFWRFGYYYEELSNYFSLDQRAFKTACEELNGKTFTVENINSLKEKTKATVYMFHLPLPEDSPEPGYQSNGTYKEKYVQKFIDEVQSGKVPADKLPNRRPYSLSVNTGYSASWGCALSYIVKEKTLYIHSEPYFSPTDD